MQFAHACVGEEATKPRVVHPNERMIRWQPSRVVLFDQYAGFLPLHKYAFRPDSAAEGFSAGERLARSAPSIGHGRRRLSKVRLMRRRAGT